jgi:hypothetical protein
VGALVVIPVMAFLVAFTRSLRDEAVDEPDRKGNP